MNQVIRKQKQNRKVKMTKISGRQPYLFTLVLLLFSCGDSTPSRLAIPSIESEIVADGIIDEDAWEQARVIKGLVSPWPNEENVDKTTFRAFVSPKYLNFVFDVRDNTVTTVPFENEASVEREDRVELFFSSDTTLARYYCIEIDPNGNVLDYSAAHYRDFNQSWDFTSKELAAKITETGYMVEGKISLLELKELGISSPFYLGIFRADYKSLVTEDVTWFSWIRPESPTPDFHIPSAFGKTVIKE